jgi:hypothetical protein
LATEGKREEGTGKRECTVGVEVFGVMELGVVKIPLSNSNSKLELSSPQTFQTSRTF